VRGGGVRGLLNGGGQKAWQARVIHDAACRLGDSQQMAGRLVWLRNECLMPTQEAWAFIKAAWVWEGAQSSRQEGVREGTWQLMKAMERSVGG